MKSNFGGKLKLTRGQRERNTCNYTIDERHALLRFVWTCVNKCMKLFAERHAMKTFPRLAGSNTKVSK